MPSMLKTSIVTHKNTSALWIIKHGFKHSVLELTEFLSSMDHCIYCQIRQLSNPMILVLIFVPYK